MIDFSYSRPEPSVEDELAAMFGEYGFRVAPAMIPSDETEALPGLSWTAVRNERSFGAGGGGIVTPEEIRILFTVFFGAYLAALGTAAGTDTYQALRRAVRAIMSRAVGGGQVKVTWIRVASVDSSGGVSASYELPEDANEADRALNALQTHRQSLSAADGEQSFTWDAASGAWTVKKWN